MLYTSHMKLILGIGNPERQYDGTRHNVGFQMLDKIAADAGVSFKRSDKFRADIAEISMSGEKALLVKPTTYYNLVGESARSLLDFYKLSPGDFLIIHDDLALPLGTVRTRVGGSDGGNNGLKSLSAHVGTGTASESAYGPTITAAPTRSRLSSVNLHKQNAPRSKQSVQPYPASSEIL